jgi:hypothetical protein
MDPARSHTEEMFYWKVSEHSKMCDKPYSYGHQSGEKITKVGKVPNADELKTNPRVRVIQGRGRTLMSGLGDAHTHFTWNGGDLGGLGDLGIEEHTLLTMRSAQCYLDSGYTMYVHPHFLVVTLRTIKLTSNPGVSEQHPPKTDSMLLSEMPLTLAIFPALATSQTAKRWLVAEEISSPASAPSPTVPMRCAKSLTSTSTLV